MSRKTRRKVYKNDSKRVRKGEALALYTGSGLTLGALAFSGSLHAADADQQTTPPPPASSDQLQEVVITGIRASLQKSLDVKEQAIGVVDAISSEDIGQFPDASLGDAVARIPGVTVNRGAINGAAAAGAVTATGQVTGLTIRGFGSQFIETLTDDRVIASGAGQSFDAEALGAQYVSEIDVLKTPDFGLSTGAIGGTVNIKFPNPLDNPGLHTQAFGQGATNANDGSVRPAGGALFSDTFADNTLGFLIAGDYTNTHVQDDHLDDVGWKGTTLACNQFAVAPAGSGCTPGSTASSAVPSWFLQDQAMYLERTDSTRKDGRLSLQWHPNDAVLVTIDDNYARDTETTDRWQFSTWFGTLSNVTQDANGTITDFTYSDAPTDFNAFAAQTDVETNTPGLNVKWDVSDNWTATLDAAQSVSRLNPNGTFSDIDADVGYGPNTAVGTNGYTGGVLVSQNPNNIPYWTAYGPGAVANGSSTPVASSNFLGLDPYIIGSHVLPIQIQENTDRINQAKLDATWHTEDTNVRFGVQFVDDDWSSKEYDNFTNNEWELWSGYGSASNNYEYYCAAPYTSANAYGTTGGNCGTKYSQTNPGPGAIAVVHGTPLPPSMFTPISVKNFIPGYNGSNLPQSLLLFSPYSVLNYLITQPIDADWAPTAGYPQYTGGYPTEVLSTGSVQEIDRKNYAPFATAEHDFKLDDMTLKVDVGLRYQRTDTTIAGLAAQLQSLSTEPGDDTAYAFNLGPAVPTVAHNNYGYLLPSLDLNLLVQPNLKVRFDYSRTETPPSNGQIIPNTTFGGRVNALSATGNNPDLLPYLSENFDLGSEWYYGRNDYLAGDVYFKHVTQFPVSNIVPVTVPGVVNTSSLAQASSGDGAYLQPAIFQESTVTNGLEADVTGFEGTLQQMLWGGFGFQLNGTWVHSNRNFNPYDTTTNQFALPGIGSSANLIALYEAYGVHARLAVQWQATQLLQLGQEQGGGAFGNEPVYLASNTEVDFSTSYDINPHFNVYFEADNLSDNVYHTYGRFPNQLLDLIAYGRSYDFGVRFKL